MPSCGLELVPASSEAEAWLGLACISACCIGPTGMGEGTEVSNHSLGYMEWVVSVVGMEVGYRGVLGSGRSGDQGRSSW